MTVEQVLIDCGFEWIEEERGKDYFAGPVPSATNTHKPGTIATLGEKSVGPNTVRSPPRQAMQNFLRLSYTFGG